MERRLPHLYPPFVHVLRVDPQKLDTVKLDRLWSKEGDDEEGELLEGGCLVRMMSSAFGNGCGCAMMRRGALEGGSLLHMSHAMYWGRHGSVDNNEGELLDGGCCLPS